MSHISMFAKVGTVNLNIIYSSSVLHRTCFLKSHFFLGVLIDVSTFSRRYKTFKIIFSKNLTETCLIYRAFLKVIVNNQFSMNLFLSLTFSSSYMVFQEEPTAFKTKIIRFFSQFHPKWEPLRPVIIFAVSTRVLWGKTNFFPRGSIDTFPYDLPMS